MARRRKTSIAEDLMDAVSLLPWWVGVLLAIAGYWFLHSVASEPLAVAALPGQPGGSVIKVLWKGAAAALQYIVPVVCLGGAFMSAWRLWRDDLDESARQTR